jgi:hypothetical protein
LKFALTMCVLAALASGLVTAEAEAKQARHENYTGLTSIRYADAWCESSGNIHAIGWHGIYRGKWQFDGPTWRAYAPPAWKYVDPAQAPEWVQDRTALNVPYDAWPRC